MYRECFSLSRLFCVWRGTLSFGNIGECVFCSGSSFFGSLFITVVGNLGVFNFLTLGYVKVLFLEKSCTPADLKIQTHVSFVNGLRVKSRLMAWCKFFQYGIALKNKKISPSLQLKK